MSRVLEFSDGAERGDLSWWTIVFDSNLSINTSDVLHGTYCYRIGSGTYGIKTIATPLAELYFRTYIKFTSGYAAHVLFRSGSTALVSMYQDAILARLNITGATTGNTGNDSLTFGWQCLEVRYKISDTVGVLTVRLDGVEVFTFSGDTKPGADSTIDNIYVGNGSGGALPFHIDDFALDTSAWCGLGYYVALTPNAAGDVTEWTPTGAANYQNVSIPANDATYNTGTTGQTDAYAMTTTTLGASMVERVIPFVRASNPAGGTLNVGVKTVGTEYTSSVTTPTSLAWLVGAEYTVNPNTSSDWTQAQIDAVQFVVDVP